MQLRAFLVSKLDKVSDQSHDPSTDCPSKEHALHTWWAPQAFGSECEGQN